MTNKTDPRNAGWTVLAGVAGAAVLGFAGAPQSLDLVFLVGPDYPNVIGEQLAVAVCGALATAVAVLRARHWRWLSALGAVGVLVAFLWHNPDPLGFTVDVRSPGGENEATRLPVPVVWAAGLVASTGMLVVGLFGAVQALPRPRWTRTGLAGLVGAAAYLGVSVIGGVRGANDVFRLVVLALAVGAVLFVVVRHPGGNPAPTRTGRRLEVAAAVAVLFSVLPTLLVLIRGEAGYGTVAGGLAGLVLLVVAPAAAARAGVAGVLAVGAVGLVLAAPVFLLLVLYDAMIGHVWYGWPVALAGVLLGVAVAGRRWPAPAVVAAAALPGFAVVAGVTDLDRPSGEVLLWLFLALTVAAVSATVGTAAEQFVRLRALPALAALGTVAALGVHGTLNLARVGADGEADIEKVSGTTAQVISSLMLIGAAALLVLLDRHRRAKATTSQGAS